MSEEVVSARGGEERPGSMHKRQLSPAASDKPNKMTEIYPTFSVGPASVRSTPLLVSEMRVEISPTAVSEASTACPISSATAAAPGWPIRANTTAACAPCLAVPRAHPRGGGGALAVRSAPGSAAAFPCTPVRPRHPAPARRRSAHAHGTRRWRAPRRRPRRRPSAARPTACPLARARSGRRWRPRGRRPLSRRCKQL